MRDAPKIPGGHTMKTVLLASTAAMALVFSQAGVMAQTAHDQAPSANAPVNQSTHTKEGMGVQIRDMLQTAGFRDIKIAPGSFLVHAKDKSGNPVVMNVGPDSLTEVTEVGDKSGEQTGSNDKLVPSNTSGSRFVSVPSSDELSSKIVGLDVYNNDNKNVGQIKDI